MVSFRYVLAGSRSRGMHQEDSDFDVYLVLNKKAILENFWKYQNVIDKIPKKENVELMLAFQGKGNLLWIPYYIPNISIIFWYPWIENSRKYTYEEIETSKQARKIFQNSGLNSCIIDFLAIYWLDEGKKCSLKEYIKKNWFSDKLTNDTLSEKVIIQDTVNEEILAKYKRSLDEDVNPNHVANFYRREEIQGKFNKIKKFMEEC